MQHNFPNSLYSALAAVLVSATALSCGESKEHSSLRAPLPSGPNEVAANATAASGSSPSSSTSPSPAASSSPAVLSSAPSVNVANACPSFASFQQVMAPIMSASCASCHGAGGPGNSVFAMSFGTGSGACATLVPTWQAAEQQINYSSPSSSNLLLKPQGQLSHGGGIVLNAAQVQVFNTWITQDAACHSGGEPGSNFDVTQLCNADGSTAAPTPLQTLLPVPATVYVSKVKNILVGLPATDAEVSAVTGDPTQLAGLITQWTALPQYQSKMLSFFGNAFQQSQAQYNDFLEQGIRIDSSTTLGAGSMAPYLLANLRESFGRTALSIANSNQPFTTLLSTNSFMMTPPLMAYYALLDSKLIPDNNSNSSSLPALNALTGFVIPGDFTNWNMVSVAVPTGSQTPTSFATPATFQSTNALLLNVPRAGFYTTPSFLAQWQTNSSNQARVTMNQTWIVGVGTPFNGADQTAPKSLAALDATHSTPGSTCYSCHVTLDPMRQYFRQAYSLYFHQQTSQAEEAMPGMFAFEGVSSVGKGIADLGVQMASSNAFAAAWTQKLCTYANSAPCLTSDPEFQRLTQLFVSSGYNWTTLVNGMFSSPIVTFAQSTPTEVANLGAVSIARRTHLCALYSSRLGISDVCGLNPATVVPSNLRTVQSVALGLSDDSYSRGAAAPVLVTQPSMFYYGGVRNICVALSSAVVDAGASSKYVSTNSTAAIADFASNLMGLTSARAAPIAAVLQSHYTAAMTAGLSASNALKSTFVLACTAPTTVSIGQ